MTPRDSLGQPLGPGLPVSITSDRGGVARRGTDVSHGRCSHALLAEGPRQSGHHRGPSRGTLLDQQPVVHLSVSAADRPPFVVGACGGPLERSETPGRAAVFGAAAGWTWAVAAEWSVAAAALCGRLGCSLVPLLLGVCFGERDRTGWRSGPGGDFFGGSR